MTIELIFDLYMLMIAGGFLTSLLLHFFLMFMPRRLD